MKKKLLAGALALLVLLGCVTVGWAGRLSDPLISLSYLTGTFFDGLKDYVTQWVSQDTQELLTGPGQTSADGWTTSYGFVPGEGESGDTVTLTEGSGLIWNDGVGEVSSGALVDATTGTELAAGETLTAGHRYLAAEDTVVAVSSQAQWMAEGKWLFGTEKAEISPLPFIDVPEDAWYYDDVRFVVDNGLFNGTSENEFSPGTSMWRGMVTTVLHRLAGEPEVSYSPMFSDVPDGQWYTKGTLWCAQMGIVGGIGDGLFAPDRDVDRQQLAVMLYRYAVQMGYNADEREDLSAFSDGSTVASWAQEAVSWAVRAGIINGGDGGKLYPDLGADRSQVAAMLHRFYNWLEAQGS